jgi:hypothetical protein
VAAQGGGPGGWSGGLYGGARYSPSPGEEEVKIGDPLVAPLSLADNYHGSLTKGAVTRAFQSWGSVRVRGPPVTAENEGKKRNKIEKN